MTGLVGVGLVINFVVGVYFPSKPISTPLERGAPELLRTH